MASVTRYQQQLLSTFLNQPKQLFTSSARVSESVPKLNRIFSSQGGEVFQQGPNFFTELKQLQLNTEEKKNVYALSLKSLLGNCCGPKIDQYIQLHIEENVGLFKPPEAEELYTQLEIEKEIFNFLNVEDQKNSDEVDYLIYLVGRFFPVFKNIKTNKQFLFLILSQLWRNSKRDVVEAAIPYLNGFTDGLDCKVILESINSLGSERGSVLKTAQPYLDILVNPTAQYIDGIFTAIHRLNEGQRDIFHAKASHYAQTPMPFENAIEDLE